MARSRTPPTTRSRSGGGFLLGMFAGVVLGLALALGIAFYLNKTPIPFITAKPSTTPTNMPRRKPPSERRRGLAAVLACGITFSPGR